MGLTAGPQYPPCEESPPTLGRGVSVSRSMPVMELMVLMAERASAPPERAARAARRMSVILGVSFTITGVRATSLTHCVIMQVYSGTWPTAELVDDLAGLLALLADVEDEVARLGDLVVVAALGVAVRAQYVQLA